MYAEKDIRLNGNRSFEFNILPKKPASIECRLISNMTNVVLTILALTRSRYDNETNGQWPDGSCDSRKHEGNPNVDGLINLYEYQRQQCDYRKHPSKVNKHLKEEEEEVDIIIATL